MTNRFEYREQHGDKITILPAKGGILIEADNAPWIPLDQVEEVIAGIRDMARQAGGQPEPGPCMCGPRTDEHVTVSGRLLCDSCDPDDTASPTCTGYDALDRFRSLTVGEAGA